MKRIAIALSTIFCVAIVGVLGRAALREPVEMSSFAVSTTPIETIDPAPAKEEWRDRGCQLEDCSYAIPTPPLVTRRPAPSVPTRATASPAKMAPKHTEQSQPTAKPTPPPMHLDETWQRTGHVAHAFGSPVDGTIYTNSAEAFEHSYNNGFRAFEVDMMLLADGGVALVHNGFERIYGVEKKFRESTLEELEDRKFDDKFAMLFGKDLVEIVASHPNAYFILDTKIDHVAIAKWLVEHMHPSSLDRLRPHVHSQEQIDALKKLYEWKGMVIATYLWKPDASVIERQTLDLAAVNRIGTVMFRDDYYSDGMRERFAAAGVKRLWIHDAVTSKDVTAWREKGLGVYSHGYISR